MPRKYKRGGAVTPENVPQNSSDNLVLLMGGFIFLVVLGGILYYFMAQENNASGTGEEEEPSQDNVKTCETLQENCPEGTFMKEGKICGENCNIARCCEEKSCNPPSFVPDAYKADDITWSKVLKFSDFEGDNVKSSAIDVSKMSCDTANDYSGTPNIKRCGENGDNWEFIGCNDNLQSCNTGKNPDDGGHPFSGRRSSVANCEQAVELSVWDTIEEQYLRCDEYYQNDGKFCKLIDDANNNCLQGAKCRRENLNRVIREVVRG